MLSDGEKKRRRKKEKKEKKEKKISGPNSSLKQGKDNKNYEITKLPFNINLGYYSPHLIEVLNNSLFFIHVKYTPGYKR